METEHFWSVVIAALLLFALGAAVANCNYSEGTKAVNNLVVDETVIGEIKCYTSFRKQSYLVKKMEGRMAAAIGALMFDPGRKCHGTELITTLAKAVQHVLLPGRLAHRQPAL